MYILIEINIVYKYYKIYTNIVYILNNSVISLIYYTYFFNLFLYPLSLD